MTGLDPTTISRHGLIALQSARALRREVRADLSNRAFGGTDVQMGTYNDLARHIAGLFPDDPILGQELTLMPDAVLRGYTTIFPITSMPVQMPAERLKDHLSRLIARLETILGEAPEAEAPSAPPEQDQLSSALEDGSVAPRTQSVGGPRRCKTV